MNNNEKITTSENKEEVVKSKRKLDKTQVITLLLTIIFAVAAAILIICKIGNKEEDKKPKEQNKIVDGKFDENKYYYEKADSNEEGPMPSYYIFDVYGKYVNITVSPNPSGETGSYKIDGDEITLSREYYYTTVDGLKVEDPRLTSAGHVNLGEYKEDKITVYGHKLNQVSESKFKKDVKNYYTYNDILYEYTSEYYSNQNKKDEPTAPIDTPPTDKKDELEFKVEKNGITAETKYGKEDKIPGYRLYINGKLAKNIGYIGKNSVQILDDIVIAAGSDTDIRTTALYIFDKNANLLKEIYTDFSEPNLMISEVCGKSYDDCYDYKIDGKDITFNADAFFHMDEIYVGKDDLITKKEYCNTTKYDDVIVDADFKITYLGNGKLSEIKEVKSEKLSELKKDVCNSNNYNDED